LRVQLRVQPLQEQVQEQVQEVPIQWEVLAEVQEVPVARGSDRLLISACWQLSRRCTYPALLEGHLLGQS
jgi:hypothetical protein